MLSPVDYQAVVLISYNANFSIGIYPNRETESISIFRTIGKSGKVIIGSLKNG